ncbi:MAG: FtsW/RodA/SpoVE family cell cycle protein [Clostridiaceae bacterium]|nr:FtsW/RodA/SpoVE family cell cycle protein [Clostridiaceae bacterium]
MSNRHSHIEDSSFDSRKIELESPYRLNIPMLLLTIVLICYGLIMLFSASISVGYNKMQNPLYFVVFQGQMTFVGVIFIAILLFIPIKTFNRISLVVIAMSVSVALLVYTWQFGMALNGARRWIEVGSKSFQTSEVVKVALVFSIAGYRSYVIRMRQAGRLLTRNPKWQDIFDSFIDIVLPVSVIAICLLLVLMQPHVSSFVILSAITLICFLVSGIKLKSWFYGGSILIIAGIVLGSCFYLVSSESQKEKIEKNFAHVFVRLNIFETMTSDDDESVENDTQPDSTDDSSLYQNKQSTIAIGSGGLRGLGFGNSRQKYMYLPEAHNDFVYSIACEELGLIGGSSIILLFWAFFVGGMAIAWRTKDVYSRILAVGYTSLITIQAFLNIAVAIGAIPPTGVTLPFFSAGGSANLFFLVAVGMILSVSRSGVKRKKTIIVSEVMR